MRTVRAFIISAAMLACTVVGIAQTSEPTPLPMPARPIPVAADRVKEETEMAANIKELQELKALNDDILKQQQATLDQLDELQKAADQLRIFSKRG
jgi:urease alpha subunit